MKGLRLVPLSAYHIDCRSLEVEPGASLEEIKQAYRDQTKVWHPDRFVNDLRLQKKAEEKIKQISLAYRRLCGLSPYGEHEPTPEIPKSSSDWEIAFFALGRALKNSFILVSKPFIWSIGTAFSITNCVFQWCCREKKSLAIATSAFVLGFGFGVWLLPRDSATWVKITSLLQRAIEKNGTAQPAVAQVSGAVPTVPPQTALTAAPSPETVASLPSSSSGTTSDMSATEASVDIFSAGKDNTIKSFELGEEPLTEETSTPFTDVWEHSLRTFSGTDAPKTIARGNYVPVSFVPDQSALYFGLLSNDIEEGQLKAEEQNVVPRFNQIVAEPTRVVVRQQSEDNLKTSDVYPAAVEPLHAGGGANESIVSPSAVTPKKDLADRKKQTSQVSIKPLQARRAPTGSVLAVSAAKAVTTYAPRPDYPEEARSHHIAGSGVCLVLVDPFSGNVTNASIAKSTGSPVLDKSVLRTLRTWKFKPGTVSQVSIPIEFTTETENP